MTVWVGEKASARIHAETLDRLDLYDELVLDHDVDSVVADLDALKPNVKDSLAFLLEAPIRVHPRGSHRRESALTLFRKPHQTNAQGVARLH